MTRFRGNQSGRPTAFVPEAGGARYLAAADGVAFPDPPARWAWEQTSPGPRPLGVSAGTWQIAPWSDYVEVHWAPGAEAYVTPVC